MKEMKNTIVDILQSGLEKGLITPFDSTTVLDTLHSFLQKYPTYEPKRARVHNTNKAMWTADPARDLWTADEVEMWKKVQPILDKTQGYATLIPFPPETVV